MDGIAIIVSILNADSAVKAVVGAANYPIEFPQGALPPCNVVNIIGGTDEQMLDGRGAYYEARIRVVSLATDDAAISLGTKVRTALEDVTKESVGTATDVDIRFADTDITTVSDDRSMMQRTQDFYVRYR